MQVLFCEHRGTISVVHNSILTWHSHCPLVTDWSYSEFNGRVFKKPLTGISVFHSSCQTNSKAERLLYVISVKYIVVLAVRLAKLTLNQCKPILLFRGRLAHLISAVIVLVVLETNATTLPLALIGSWLNHISHFKHPLTLTTCNQSTGADIHDIFKLHKFCIRGIPGIPPGSSI